MFSGRFGAVVPNFIACSFLVLPRVAFLIFLLTLSFLVTEAILVFPFSRYSHLRVNVKIQFHTADSWPMAGPSARG